MINIFEFHNIPWLITTLKTSSFSAGNLYIKTNYLIHINLDPYANASKNQIY